MSSEEKEIVFDTEFLEGEATLKDGRTVPVLDLISIGMVDQDGNTYYAVSNEFNLQAADEKEWVKDNVLVHLPPQKEWKSREQIRNEITEFIGEDPTRFHYWVISHDATIFNQLMAPQNLMELPSNYNRLFNNIAQDFNRLGRPDGIIPPTPENQHNALTDALWTQEILQNLRAYEKTNCSPT